MQNKFSLTLLLLLLTAAALAVPARRVRMQCAQPDGTTLWLTAHGDEQLHFFRSDDGLPILRAANGSYCHAQLDDEGALVPSTQWAHEPAQRGESEKAFLHHRGPAEPMLRQARARAMQHHSATRAVADERVPQLGNRQALVVLAEFADTKFVLPQARNFFDTLYNADPYPDASPRLGHQGSLRQYFLDQSQGALDIHFDVVGPVCVSRELSYYGSNDRRGNDRFAGKMVEEAVRLASPGVDFDQYDWNRDGEVDILLVIYAGYNEAQHPKAEYTIWPHTASLQDYGIQPIRFGNTRVNAYACTSELSLSEGQTPCAIGPIAHELAHVLGLQDTYDTDYSGGYGMQCWSMMDYGCYLGPMGIGEVPCNLTSFERYTLGWMELTHLAHHTTITDMPSITQYGPGYVLSNEAQPDEFFLFENRQQTGWDSHLPHHGLLVTHVDYDARAWARNQVNDSPAHQRYTVVPADGSASDDSPSVDDQRGDLFPYHYMQDGMACTTDWLSHFPLFSPGPDGSLQLHRSVTHITESQEGTISFEMSGTLPDAIHTPWATDPNTHTRYTLQGLPAPPHYRGPTIHRGRVELRR